MMPQGVEQGYEKQLFIGTAGVPRSMMPEGVEQAEGDVFLLARPGCHDQ